MFLRFTGIVTESKLIYAFYMLHYSRDQNERFENEKEYYFPNLSSVLFIHIS